MPVLVPPVQTALWAVGQQVAARALGGRRRPGRLSAAAAVTCIGVGAATAATAVRRFTGAGTTYEPWEPERASVLVTDGPNAFTRNPMYLGLTLVLVGNGLLTGRPATCLAAAGLVTTLTPQIRREEAALAGIFGPEWTAYSGRVRRWL
ncbi:methyltransferase family protein [Nocardioides coralli]|uniref:methyltransferase family protein n=1 Tax=Nocardioides coralli TaxID=2872154 RepID=UPI001CA3E8BE|nr:isoprenylcysteine carboxylmethyltransferase family protein [Nocardioides coralli]QZY29979.1 isoprenylcysteine carboxylmethyltransferase family protein [Nocardioides coralli]